MMKIVYRRPKKTADISSGRNTSLKELWQLVLFAALLLIALFFITGWTVDIIVEKISFETEAKVFKHIKVPVVETTNAPHHQKDLKRAQKILDALQKNPTVAPLPYRLVLIDEASPNAFAFPGGTIAMTTGLLKALNKDIQIAFVLGHELGHFHNRDHLQGMGRAIGFRFIIAAIFGGQIDSFGNMIEFILQNEYSQDREKAADRYGLELVHTTYAKMEGVDRLFRILLETDSIPQWAYMFSTHPSPAKRIDDLKAHAAKLDR